LWGAISFANNYSAALVNRASDGFEVGTWDVEAADMVITLDMSGKKKS
jgi:hypothetical protein